MVQLGVRFQSLSAPLAAFERIILVSLPVLTWNSQLVTGLDEVDSQHRHLIDLINGLGELYAGAATQDELLRTVSELRQYTLTHFRTESDLMHAWPVNIARREQHLIAHRIFVEHVDTAGKLVTDGATTADIIESLLAFLIQWLVHHISHIDVSMAKEICALRAGTLSPDAENAEDGLQNALMDTVTNLNDSIGARTFELLELNQRLEAELARRHLAEQALAKANQTLAAREAMLQQILDTSSVAIFLVNKEGRITHANRCMAEMFHCTLEDLTAKEYIDLIHPSEQESGKQKMLALLESQYPSVDLERRYWRADDTEFLGHLTGKRFYEVDGTENGLVGVIADVSARKQAETRLQLVASVFTYAHEGIMITDASGTIMEVNDTFTAITEYRRDEVVGQNPRMFQSGRHTPDFYLGMWKSIAQTGHWSGEVWNRTKSGRTFAQMITISAVRDADGVAKNYVALFTDITPMKEYQGQLEHIAHYDPLTGLANRVLLADRLQQAIIQSQRQGRMLAVVYLDLDGFKEVNDEHGHHTGDELLIALAQRMKSALRQRDTLARIGGDEFVAVLAELERAQDCDPVLVRLLHAASDAVVVRDQVLRVSASIGVALYPQDGAEADLLLRYADQAMYQAKQAGKNRYHLFDVVQNAVLKTQQEYLLQIRRALDSREFVLYYQPKVNMKTGVVIGAEALIRWQHPERGLLLPEVFLPAIENHPVSIALSDWVIETALLQMELWSAAGHNIPVSVNVGAHQLQQAGFVARLAELLRLHPGAQPDSLELEILETSALEDIDQVSGVMHACRLLGVHFALDDFGTGYSSLSYLKRLPAELLKIDQDFVRDILEDPEDLAIVEAVIGLAATFRRQVIAEGVETLAQGEMLLSLGCELGQGYGIAVPMPAHEFPLWAASWRPEFAAPALGT